MLLPSAGGKPTPALLQFNLHQELKNSIRTRDDSIIGGIGDQNNDAKESAVRGQDQSKIGTMECHTIQKMKNLVCILIDFLAHFTCFSFFLIPSSSSTLLRPSVYDDMPCVRLSPHLILWKHASFPSFSSFMVSSHCDPACSTCLMSPGRFENSQCHLHALDSFPKANWNLN